MNIRPAVPGDAANTVSALEAIVKQLKNINHKLAAYLQWLEPKLSKPPEEEK